MSGLDLRGKLSAAIVAVALLTSGGPGWAAPSGGSIPAGGGSGTIQQSGGVTTIQQQTNRLIINWNSFGIGASELVKFVQPSQLAAVLNRVTGLDPSVIMGSLQANGRVFLVNPNGIFFGASSRVDVGSLMATTLDIKNEDFLKGIYRFAQDPTKPASFVVNQGHIQATDGGFVVLAAPLVSNEGVIIANLGHVTLSGTAGTSISLDSQGLVNYVLPTDAGPAADVMIPPEILSQVVKQAVESGLVKGGLAVQEGDHVRLVGAGGLALNAGTIQANGPTGSVTVNGARETLLTDGSKVTATGGPGETGGQVILTGDKVGLLGNASVDVSGAAGGGKALIGGDYQGKGTVPLAGTTYVAPNATIHADATDSGNGGSVYVWGNLGSYTYGLISARGGPHGGNGGFVETSSHGGLRVAQVPDVTAPRGDGGNWLLDPLTLIVSTANFNQFWDPAAAYGSPLDGTQTNAQLDHALINTALNSGISVTLTTVPNFTATDNSATPGDILIQADITKTGGADASLTMLADRNISINGVISSSSNKLNVGLTATRGLITEASTVNTNGGNFTATSAGGYSQSGTVNTGGGNFTNAGTSYNLTGNTITGGGTFRSTGTSFTMTGNITTNGGDVLIGTAATPRAGAVALNGNVNAGAGRIQISTDNGATTQLAGTSVVANGLSLLNANGGDFTINQTNNSISTLAANTHSGVNFRNVGGFSVGTVTTVDHTTVGVVTANNPVTLRADGTISVDQLLNAGTNAVNIRVTSGDIVSSGPGTVNGGTVTLRSDIGNIGTGPGNRLATSADTLDINDGAGNAGATSAFINEANAVTLDNIRTLNTFDILAGGTITIAGGAGKQVQAPTIALHATSGDIVDSGNPITRLVGTTLTAIADTGSVGSNPNPLLTDVSTLLAASANGGGQGVFISNDKDLAVTSATSTGANGTVQLTTTTGGLTLQNGAIVTAQGSGTVNLTAATGITDGTSTSITGNALTASAGTGSVGSAGNLLNTQLNTLTSVTANSDNQGVFLSNSGINTPLTVNSVTATGANGSVRIDNNSSTTLGNGAIVTAVGTGNVQLLAVGTIDDGALTSITANTLTIRGTGGIGSNPNPLNTHINTLTSATTAGAGSGIFLSNDQNLAVTLAQAGNTGIPNTTVQLTTTSGGLTLGDNSVITSGSSGTVQLFAATGILDGTATSVTGNTLTASAGTGSIGANGNALNTHINTLTSATANSDNQGVFLSNDQTLAVTSATSTGNSGTVQLTTTAGALNLANNAVVTADLTGIVQLAAATNIADAGLTSVTGDTLTATATTGSIGSNGNPLHTSINTLLSAAANGVNQGVFLSNDEALAVTSATATGANGTVQLTTTLGDLTLANNAIVTSNATGTVQLTAAGSITDGSAISITGNSLTLQAITGSIGGGTPLDTQVHVVSGQANGLINMNNSGSLLVNLLSSTTSTVTLTNDNQITVAAGTAVSPTMFGTDVSITENGIATGGILVNGPLLTSANETILGTNSVTITNNSTGAGSGISITAPQAGSIAPATVAGPTVTVRTTGATGTPHDITLGDSAIQATNAILSSMGSIVDGANTSVTATNGTFTAVGGNVGQNASNPLNTSLNTLVSAVANSNNQGVFLSNDKALIVLSATSTGTNGRVELTTTSGMLTLVDGAIVTATDTGTVKLTAANGIVDQTATSITANSLTASAGTGSIGANNNFLNTSLNTLSSATANSDNQGVFLSNNKSLAVTSATATGANGTVKLTTTSGGLTLADNAVVTSGGTGNVVLSAATGILDGTADSITANTLTATAATGSVGANGNALNTHINTLVSAAANSDNQGVFLTNDQALAVTSATATGNNGTVQLTATAGGLTLADNAVVTSTTTGTVQLTAATNIIDGTVTSVTGNTLTATANTGRVGLNGNPLNTDINTLLSAAANSPGQGVFLTNDKDLAVTSVTATGTNGTVQLTTTSGNMTLSNNAIVTPTGTGTVQLTAAGSITDSTSTSITGNALTATATTGTLGASGNPLDTQIHVLYGTANGLINVNNSGTLTVNRLSSTAGAVTLTNDNSIEVSAPTVAAAGPTVLGTVVSITENGTATGGITVDGPSGTASDPSVRGTTSVTITNASTGTGSGISIQGVAPPATSTATVIAPAVTVSTTGGTGTPHDITLGTSAVNATTANLSSSGSIVDGTSTSVTAASGTFTATGGNVGQSASNPLNTSLNTLVSAAANSNNQGVFLSNNQDLVVQSATATGTNGTVQLTTTAGGLTLLNSAIVTPTATGTVQLTAAAGIIDGTATSITGNALTASAGTGSIGANGNPLNTHINTLTSAAANSASQGVFLSNDQSMTVTSATATGTNGIVQLATTSGALTLANNAIVTPGATGSVTLTAASDITDGTATSITANTLTATATAGSVGANGNPLDTHINTLTSAVANSANQGVFLSNDQSLAVTSATATGTNGTVRLTTTNGGLTLANGAVVTPGATGTVQLTAATGIIDGAGTSVTGNALTATAGTGSVGANGNALNTQINTLTSAAANGANQGVFLTNNQDLAVTSATAAGTNGTVQLTATTGSLTLGNGAVVTPGTSGTVQLTANTSITDGTATSVTANTLTATATLGSIGTGANPLNTQVHSLTASADANNQRVNVTNSGTLALANVSAAGNGGGVTVVNDSSMTASLVVAGNAANPGSVTLVANGGDLTLASVTALNGTSNLSATAGSILDGAGVSVTTGTVNLFALVNVGAPNNFLEVSASTVNAVAQTGAVYMGFTSPNVTINSLQTGGAVNLTAANNITLNGIVAGTDVNVNAGNSATLNSIVAGHNVGVTTLTGDISVTSVTAGDTVNLVALGGSILNLGNTINANVTNLRAFATIGTSDNPLRTNVNLLNATANTGIFIAEKDSLLVGDVQNLGVGAVRIVSNTGNMAIGTVTNKGGGVTLQATSGNLYDNGDNLFADVNANGISYLLAGGTIGSQSDPLQVNVIGQLLVQAGGKFGDNGSVFINGTVLPSNDLTIIGAPPGLVVFNGRRLGGVETDTHDSGLSAFNPSLTLELLSASTATFQNLVYPQYYTPLMANTITTSQTQEKDASTIAEVDRAAAERLAAQTENQLHALEEVAAGSSKSFVNSAVQLLTLNGWTAADAGAAAQAILKAVPGDTRANQVARVKKLRELLNQK